MVYVALLRGVNVGGKGTVPMVRLKVTFEGLGFADVRTYINSGNVIFRADGDEVVLWMQIEQAIERDFGFAVPTLLRSQVRLENLARKIPGTWVNDTEMRCDVMFLGPEIDQPNIVEQIPHRPEVEDVVYFPGAVVWRVDRANVRRGQVPKIIGTGIYKQLTIRNINTVRKLLALMQAA